MNKKDNTKDPLLKNAIMEAKNVEETLKENAKAIFKDVIDEDLDEILKRRINESEDEEEVEDDVEGPADDAMEGADEEDAVADGELPGEDMEDEADMEDDADIESGEDELPMDDEDMEDGEEMPADVDSDEMGDEEVIDLDSLDVEGSDEEDEIVDLTGVEDEDELMATVITLPKDAEIIVKSDSEQSVKVSDDQGKLSVSLNESEEEKDLLAELDAILAEEDLPLHEEEMMESEVNESEVSEGEINEGEVNESEVNEGEVNESEVNEGEINEGEEEMLDEVMINKTNNRHHSNYPNGAKGKNRSLGKGPVNESNAKLKKIINILAEKNKEYQVTLKKFRTQINEMALFNTNLALSNKLFLENATTNKEKQNIIEKFDSSKSIKESKAIYSTLKESLNKASKKDNNKQLNEKIKNKVNKVNLNETKLYENPGADRIKKLMGL